MSNSNRKCHFKETRLESIRHRQNYKVSDTSIFSTFLSQEDLFAFWFYLVALKNMKQFGRVTSQQGKTQLLLRFVFERAHTFKWGSAEWQWCPPNTTLSSAKYWQCHLGETVISALPAQSTPSRAPPCMPFCTGTGHSLILEEAVV